MSEKATPKLDLFSQQFKQNPFPTFAKMRKFHPVYRQEAPNGTVTWYVSRYADVVEVLRDSERFVKDSQNARPDSDSRRKPSVHTAINRNMLFSDPPDHTRLRALVNIAFTPKRVENMRPRIVENAQSLLDEAAPRGKMDVIADYALPLPVVVICEMLGIPKKEQAQVAAWSQVIISPGSRGLSGKARRGQMRQFVAYLEGLFERRRQDSADDLISGLLSAEYQGQRLSKDELSSMVALLLVTGHETTVNLIGNAVLTLLLNPQQRHQFAESDAILETAIEELMRFDGPVETSTTRWVAYDMEFRGQQLKQGDVVRAVITSANRDETIFPEADRLDLTRRPCKHLQFGQGIHYCLGAPLARLEGQIALKMLFERFPECELAVSAEKLIWRKGVLFRGLDALPLVLFKPETTAQSG